LAHVKSNVDSGIFRPLQEAAVRTLTVDPAWVSRRNGVYRERLEVVLHGLKAIGMAAAQPRATFYVWVRVPPEWTSETFALTLLEQAGVAVAPGSFFGPAGEGYVRFSVVTPIARIREAMERMRRFAALPPGPPAGSRRV
jgi:LL-diaminopimelate aminotransferase